MRAGVRADNPLERLGLAAGMVPEPLFEAYFALMVARSIMAASELGVFDALHDRPRTALDLARHLGLDPAATAALLAALHAQGYLDQDGEARYGPSARTKRSLTRDARTPMRAWMRFTYDIWEAFDRLEDTLRSGFQQDIHGKAPDDPYWERYMRGLFELSQLHARDVARAIGARGPRRLLDLAGGHGGFAMALCDRHPGLTATIADLEGAARVGRAIVAEQGYADRVSFLVGDLFETHLGNGYDIATAHSIVHHFPPEQIVRLLERARAALRPGGRMAVLEQEAPRPGQRGTPVGAYTGLLFCITSAARTYTGEEIAGFFTAAGFTRVRRKRLLRGPGMVLVLGDAPAPAAEPPTP